MVKLIFCLRRHPDLTWEEFSRYWGEVHAPLVAERAETLGIRRYVQMRTLQIDEVHAGLQRRNGCVTEPYDGVAELWFDDLQSFIAPSDDAARQAALELLADESNFLDLSNSPMWLGEEQVIVNDNVS